MSRTGRSLGCRLAALALAAACFAEPAEAIVVHNYLFNSGDGMQILDSAGVNTANGAIVGTATVNTSASRLELTGADGWGTLPGATIGINTFSALSLEMWLIVNEATPNVFTAAAAFGRSGVAPEDVNAGYDYLQLQPVRGGGQGSSAGITTGNTYFDEAIVMDGSRDLNDGVLHQIVATVDASNIAYYVDGVQIGAAPLTFGDPAMPINISDLSNDLALLGKSVFPNDPLLNGSIYEFRIYDNALTEMEVETLYDGGNGCQDACGSAFIEVNRDTGQAVLVNSLYPSNVYEYSIQSAAGALNPSGWDSIADTGDFNSGGSIDNDDNWAEITATINELHEDQPIAGLGNDDGAPLGEGFPLGAIWTKSPFEDLTFTMQLIDPNTFLETLNVELPVVFVGNNGESFRVSDLDTDGDSDAADYAIFLANHLTDLGSMEWIETFALGDLDGDFDNDFADFRLFQADFIAANGMAAFAALTSVPEPSSALLLGLLLSCVGLRRKS